LTHFFLSTKKCRIEEEEEEEKEEKEEGKSTFSNVFKGYILL